MFAMLISLVSELLLKRNYEICRRFLCCTCRWCTFSMFSIKGDNKSLISSCCSFLFPQSVSATPFLDLGNILGDVTGSVNNAVGSVGGVVGKLSSTLNDVVSNLSATLDCLVGTVIEIVQQLLAAVTAALNDIAKSVKGLTALAGCGGINNIVGDLIGNVNDVLSGVIGGVECLLGDLTGNLDELVANLDGLLNNLLCAVQDLLQTVIKAVAELLNKVSKAVDEALAQIQVALGAVVEVLSEALDCLLAQLQSSSLGCTVTGLVGQVSIVVADLSIEVAVLADKLVANVRVVLRTLNEELQKILASLIAALGELGLNCSCK